MRLYFLFVVLVFVLFLLGCGSTSEHETINSNVATVIHNQEQINNNLAQLMEGQKTLNENLKIVNENCNR